MAGAYPNGSPLVSNPDTDGSFVVDVGDAFNYAAVNGSSLDSPNDSFVGATASDLVLAEEYTFLWFWCWIFSYFSQPYYDAVLAGRLTPADFSRRMNSAVPKLQTIIISEADKAMVSLRRKLAPQLKKTLEEFFEE